MRAIVLMIMLSNSVLTSSFNNLKKFSIFSGTLLHKCSNSQRLQTRLKSSSKKFTINNVPDETMYILDGTSMLFHAYYSREHSTNHKDVIFSPHMASLLHNKLALPQGEADLACGALVVLAMNLARIIKDLKPRYVAVAFDAGKKTFRHDQYPLYKGNREPVSGSDKTMFKEKVSYKVVVYLLASSRTTSIILCGPYSISTSWLHVYTRGIVDLISSYEIKYLVVIRLLSRHIAGGI